MINNIVRPFEYTKDKYYGVKPVESIMQTDVMFMDPKSGLAAVRVINGKLRAGGCELEELEFNEKERTVTGKVTRFGMQHTLSLDKRLNYIERHRSTSTITKKSGYVLKTFE